ncbi:MAG: LysR substrate-binding domain-containing protein [Rhodanobacteraceae bacterium]
MSGGGAGWLLAVGIANVPESSCIEELRSGKLRVVLSEWGLPQGIVHLVYPNRRGMLPAVRALVDFLVDTFEHAWPPATPAGS